jgi:hypothetical protein
MLRPTKEANILVVLEDSQLSALQTLWYIKARVSLGSSGPALTV